MKRIPRIAAVGVLALSVTVAPSAQAQYTSDFQTNIISSVTSNWTGDYIVGSNTLADVLLILNSGVLSNGTSYLGYDVSSSNNNAVVAGSGSVWRSRSLYLGFNGKGNSLVISGGGQVFSTPLSSGQRSGYVGFQGSSISNRVFVTDSGSTWNNDGTLIVGYLGKASTLVISNGGQVASGGGRVGGIEGGAGSWSNSDLVTGNGSVWSNSGTLSIGPSKQGANSLIISDGGKVINSSGFLGYASDNNSGTSPTARFGKTTCCTSSKYTARATR